MHVMAGALVTCLEVLPPAVLFARATDKVVRAQIVESSRGVPLDDSQRLLLLTAVNNSLQLVPRHGGPSLGIYAPGRIDRRMLGMAKGVSERDEDEDGLHKEEEGDASPTAARREASAAAAPAASTAVVSLINNEEDGEAKQPLADTDWPPISTAIIRPPTVPNHIDTPGLGGAVYMPLIGCACVCWTDGSLDILEVGVGNDLEMTNLWDGTQDGDTGPEQGSMGALHSFSDNNIELRRQNGYTVAATAVCVLPAPDDPVTPNKRSRRHSRSAERASRRFLLRRLHRRQKAARLRQTGRRLYLAGLCC